jgi:hypothetical protein
MSKIATISLISIGITLISFFFQTIILKDRNGKLEKQIVSKDSVIAQRDSTIKSLNVKLEESK